MAIVRERVWGFSLFAVDEDLQGRGVGRELLERSLAYGEERGADGWIILSSREAGGDAPLRERGLRPASDARRDGRPGPAPRPGRARRGRGRRRRRASRSPTRSAASCAAPATAATSRCILETGLAAARLRGPRRRVRARGQRAAARARATRRRPRWSCGRRSRPRPPGSTALVHLHRPRAQQWALRVASTRGCRCRPTARSASRDALGPLAPFLPSGAWLWPASRTSARRASPSAGPAPRSCAWPGLLVEVRAALRAQPAAVRAAEHLQRQREREGVVRPLVQVELLVRDVRALELLALADWWTSRASTSVRGTASPRQRMHGPRSAASKRSRSDQPSPTIRDTSSTTGTSAGSAV